MVGKITQEYSHKPAHMQPTPMHSHSLPANRRDNDLLQGMCATNIILNDTSCEYQAKFRSCVSVRSTHIWQSAKGRIWVCVWERGLSLFPRPKFLGRVPDEEIRIWKEAGGTWDPLWEHCMWQNIFPHYSWGLILMFMHSIHKNTYQGTLYIDTHSSSQANIHWD